MRTVKTKGACEVVGGGRWLGAEGAAADRVGRIAEALAYPQLRPSLARG